jgi:hypothetical protein
MKDKLEALVNEIKFSDIDAFNAIFCSAYANVVFKDSKPIWIVVIGKPGSGKSFIAKLFEQIPDIITIDTMTPVALATAGTGSSLLFEVTDKVLIVSEFSAISSMRPEQKAMLFGFLRAAYDGSFVRATGQGKIEWQGRFGMIACSTDAIEREQLLASQLGERFLYVRLNPDIDSIMESAMKMTTKTTSKIDTLQKKMLNIWEDALKVKVQTSLPADTVEFTKHMSKVIAKCRTPVQRDSYTKEITFPVENGEVSTRLLQQMLVLAMSAKTLGIQEQSIIKRIALDCIPKTRAKIIQVIKHTTGLLSAEQIAQAVKLSRRMVYYYLEDMEFLEILQNVKGKYVINPDVEILF